MLNSYCENLFSNTLIFNLFLDLSIAIEQRNILYIKLIEPIHIKKRKQKEFFNVINNPWDKKFSKKISFCIKNPLCQHIVLKSKEYTNPTTYKIFTFTYLPSSLHFRFIRIRKSSHMNYTMKFIQRDKKKTEMLKIS